MYYVRVKWRTLSSPGSVYGGVGASAVYTVPNTRDRVLSELQDITSGFGKLPNAIRPGFYGPTSEKNLCHRFHLDRG